MSKQDLIKVVQRSINDAGFRRQLSTNASAALKGYDLTAEEIGALRSRDAGKLTAFGIDTRMSKVFIDPGTMGISAVTTTGEPRDVAPVWVGDGAAHGSVQTPDAAERNAAIIGDPTLSVHSVQSPDAAERNAAIIGDPTLSVSSGVQSPDAADRNAAYASSEGTSSGGVQSPDAIDRNLLNVGGAEPRDDAPVWIGDTAATQAAPIDGSAEQSFGAAMTGSEPRDTEPTWIGDSDNPTNVSGSEGAIHEQ